MRYIAIALLVGLMGCTDVPTSGGATAVSDQPAGAARALFSSRPAELFAAADAVCDAPGQVVVRPSANEVRCESLPDPESAAALILQFNGDVENLPKFVISFAGAPAAAGFVVTADSYIRVPQRTGGAQQIRFPDPRIKAELESLLETAGGQPF